MTDMLEVLNEHFKQKAEPTHPKDETFERLCNVLLEELPSTLGHMVGRTLGQMIAYGEHCHWGTATEDATAFVNIFLKYFRGGLDEGSAYRGHWPPREQVLKDFEKLVKKIDGL